MKPVWEQVKTKLANSKIEFKEIDEDLMKTPGVTEYPTILMITESGRRVKYIGGPHVTQLSNWMASPAPLNY
jgi:hypothetical protein